MKEIELLFEISHIVNGHVTYTQAVEKIQALLARHRSGAEEAERIANFARQQLGMLLVRMDLLEQQMQLKEEISFFRGNLAERKVLQRAEGLLIARRGMNPTAAKAWIEQQSHKTGLSKSDVADRIVAYYQATGLLEQRIA